MPDEAVFLMMHLAILLALVVNGVVALLSYLQAKRNGEILAAIQEDG